MTYPLRGESRLLRAALLGDSMLDGLLGLACILAAGPVAALLGLNADSATLHLRIFGMILFSSGALLLWFAAQHRISRRFVGAAIGVNVVWVIASAAAVSGPWLVLSDTGRVAVLAQAGVFAMLAALQAYTVYSNQQP